MNRIDINNCFYPQKAPFVFVDRLIKAENNILVGEKSFSINDPMISAPFVSLPFVLESLAQLANFVYLLKDDGREEIPALTAPEIPYMVAIKKAKQYKQILIGDRVELTVEVTKKISMFLIAKGRASVGKTMAVEAEFYFTTGGKKLDIK